MALQVKIFSSHDYSSSRDLERDVNRFLQENNESSVAEVPRDRLVSGEIPQIIRGYDMVVQYRPICGKPIENDKLPDRALPNQVYFLLGDYSPKFVGKGLGEFVSRKEFLDLYPDSKDPANCVRIKMFRLRKKLKEIGFNIVNGRRMGFAIVPYTKKQDNNQ